MVTKQIFKVDDDFFTTSLTEEDVLNQYEELVKKPVSVIYRGDKFVLYVGDNPEWESESLDGIFEHVIAFINGKGQTFKIKFGVEDAFNYICYNCDDKDMQISSYEFLIECTIRYGKKMK